MRDDRSADQGLLAAHRRRLMALETQAATFGLDAPAHITIEIAQITETIAALERRLSPAPSSIGAAGSFRTWVVDQMHRGDHLSIGAASCLQGVNGSCLRCNSAAYHEAWTRHVHITLPTYRPIASADAAGRIGGPDDDPGDAHPDHRSATRDHRGHV